MHKKSSFFQIAKGITFIGQVGISIITPVFVFAFLTYTFVVRKGGNSLFMVPAILLGLVTGFFSAKSFCKDMFRSNEMASTTEKKSVGYNKHI